MARKQKNTLITAEDQIKWAKELLESNGYSVFRLEDVSCKEEEDSVQKLKMLGYKIEHFKDRLVKIDPNLINDSDDIAVYFHEMLKRNNKDRFNKKKLKDKKERAVDRSIINLFLNWRVIEGKISLTRAIEELIVMIDILFEKQLEWGMDVKSIGILSVTKNRSFVVTLLREVHLRQDKQLEYEMDCVIQQEDAINYFSVLDESRQQMAKVKSPPPLKPRQVKVKE